MGAYDEDEHERRERKANSVDTTSVAARGEYNGSINYESGDSAETLLDTFEEIKSE